MRLLVLMMKLAGWGEIKLWGGFCREWGGHRIQDIEGSITHERSIGCEANIDSDVTNVTVLVTKSKNEPVSTGMSPIPVSDVAFPVILYLSKKCLVDYELRYLLSGYPQRFCKILD